MHQETSSFYSRHIVTEQGTVEGVLQISGGKMTELILHPTSQQIAQAKDFGDERIFAGIIDLHSHGYHSWSAKTIDSEEIQGLSKILPSIGVTATLATTTGWKEHEMDMLSAIAGALEQGVSGTRILGIHMEGPFFNPDKHNATPRGEVIPPSVQKCEAYWQAARGKIRYMTLAPEIEGADETIRWLRDHNIVAGAGHTLASDQQMQKPLPRAFRSQFTPAMRCVRLTAGISEALGAALLDPDVICEIICDFYHIAPRMLEIMFRVKNNFDKFIMISDSDTLSGVAPGTYFAYGKRVNVHADGRILLDDGTISGSSKFVLYGMENLIEKLGIPAHIVSRMASLNRQSCWAGESKGSIAAGKDADFFIVNDRYEVQETWVEGRLVYKKTDIIETNKHFSQFCRKLDS
ncbi:MAG: N-acetylglucosamine-6-phosphate deacetylase [Holdemania massiliensis]